MIDDDVDDDGEGYDDDDDDEGDAGLWHLCCQLVRVIMIMMLLATVDDEYENIDSSQKQSLNKVDDDNGEDDVKTSNSFWTEPRLLVA